MERTGGTRTTTLLMCDLVDSTRIVEQLGDRGAAQLFERHDRMARDLLDRLGGREIDKTDGFLLLFSSPGTALRFALAYHEGLEGISRELRARVRARVAIHHGDVILRENPARDVARGAKPIEVEGRAKPLTARLLSLATGGQTLLTREAFEEARSDPALAEVQGLEWVACGPYRAKGIGGEIEVFEAGLRGKAPLEPPPRSAKVAPAGRGDAILGWRPAAGGSVPGRPEWLLEKKLGEGGFGEVWAIRSTSGERRVLKFCFDARHLAGLRQEVTILRVLKEALGRREDIVRIFGWRLEEPPFWIELEYVEGGDLRSWLEDRDGAAAVPLPARLEIAAQVAEALAAAHSVGILHKDIKPGNVLVAEPDRFPPRTKLADFGIGTVMDASFLDSLGITRYEAAGTPDSGAGTRLYLAPEVFEGAPPSAASDVYALGVLTFQLITGNLRRPLAPGWQRAIEDEILREDVAAMVDGSPERRLADAAEVARRLRSLDERRRRREEERRAREEAERARRELVRARRRRRVAAAAGAGLLVFSLSVGYQAWRAAREARRADRAARASRQVADFLVGLFENADPARSGGRRVTARELLDAGARRVSEKLADEPLTRARLEEALGRIYTTLGVYDRADELLTRTFETRERLLEPENPERIEAMAALAVLRCRQGRREEARALASEAVSRAGGQGVPVRVLRAALEALGEVENASGDFQALHRVERRLEALGEGTPSAEEKGESRESRAVRRGHRTPVLELAGAVALPRLPSWTAMTSGDTRTLTGAGPSFVETIDLTGLAPPSPLPLERGETVVGLLDGGRVAAVGPRGLVIRTPEADRGQDLDGGVTGVRPAPGSVVAVSRDGTTAAVASAGRLRVRRLEPGERALLLDVVLPTKPRMLRCTPRWVAALVGGRVMAWDLVAARRVLDVLEWEGRVFDLAVEPVSGLLAVGGWFDEVLIYDLGRGTCVARFSEPGKTLGLAWFPDHPTLAVGKVGRVLLWRRSGGIVARYEDPEAQFVPVSFEGSGLFAGDLAENRLLWFRYRSLWSGSAVRVASGSIWTVAPGPDGRVYAGSETGMLGAWDPVSDEVTATRAHTQGVTAILVHGRRVLTASDDKTLALWKPENLACIRRSRAHRFLINALVFEPPDRVWSCSSDGTLKAWSWPGLEPVGEVAMGHLSIGAFWLDPKRGVGFAGTWNHLWLDLKREGDGGWRPGAGHRWAPFGGYRIVGVDGEDLVVMLGILPSRLVVLDPGTGRARSVDLPGVVLKWIEPAGPGRVLVAGDGVAGVLTFRRGGERVRVGGRFGVVGEGVLSAAAWAAPRRMAVFATGDGRLLPIPIARIEALPELLHQEIRFEPPVEDALTAGRRP